MIFELLVHLASRIVPLADRAEWLAEWRAELRYVQTRRPTMAASFARGAVADAWWMRRHRIGSPSTGLLESPVACITLLSVLAAVAVLLVFTLPEPRTLLASLRMPPVFAFLLQAGLALLILPSVSPLSVNDYWRDNRFRVRVFSSLKLALILPAVFFGSVIFGAVTGPGNAPLASLIGFILAFRWTLIDDRQRCPMCLRRLAYPTRIGASSNVLLDWYGTELLCTRGHGLLYLPDLPASSCASWTWFRLDSGGEGLNQNRYFKPN